MKSLWPAFVAASSLLCATAQAAPVIGFTGDFAPANWTSAVGTNGATPSADASFLSITSPRPDGFDSSWTDFSIVVGAAAKISFDWSYVTSDLDNDPFYDPFGILSVNGFTPLSDDDGHASQSGSYSVVVDAGEVFGFRAWAIDGDFGTATTRVGNFRVDFIPEPTTLLLLAAALAAASAAKRRGTSRV